MTDPLLKLSSKAPRATSTRHVFAREEVDPNTARYLGLVSSPGRGLGNSQAVDKKTGTPKFSTGPLH